MTAEAMTTEAVTTETVTTDATITETDGAAIETMALPTPIGPLRLLAHGGALVGAGFTADAGELHARLHPSLRALKLCEVPYEAHPAHEARWSIGTIAAALAAYFAGDPHALDAIPVRQPATPGRTRYYELMRAIPAGGTITYAELAARAGNPRAARAAGAACAANLIAPVVPCHRVLPSTRGYAGYYYGIDRKEWLLRHERAAR